MLLRHVIAVAALVVVALPAPTPALSEETEEEPVSAATITDATGDVGRPRGDAVRAQLLHRPRSMEVTLQVARYSNPLAHPSWLSGETGPTWLLETTGDQTTDFRVTLRHESGHFVGRIIRVSDSAEMCAGEAVSDRANSSYGFGFPRTCVERPGRARFFAAMRWDRDPASTADPILVDEVLGGHAPQGRLSAWTYAPCANPLNSTLQFSVEDTTIGPGDTARFHIRIVRQGTEIGIRYEYLELHRRLEGSDTWTTVGTGRAGAGGRRAFQDTPPDDAYYRAHHPISSCANDLTTPILTVTVN